MPDSIAQNAGELASLGTAICWVISALAFEKAGERMGSLSLNLLRLTIALLLLCTYGFATRGLLFPTDATAFEWGWFAASALVGFVLGDFCLLGAYVELGPRLTSLVMVSTPIWAALIGVLWMGETLNAQQLAGIGLVVGGIGWAVADRPRKAGRRASKSPTKKGLLLGFGGAIGQAGGLLLSKRGLERGYDPFAATQIRVLVGMLCFALIVTATRWWPKVIAAVKDREAILPTAIGGTFGPFLGVALSLIGVHLTAEAGVAATLMALTPILLIPVVRLRGESVGFGGWAGAVIGVAGAALLFFAA